MVRIENKFKIKTKYYTCASEFQSIALQRGVYISSYLQELLKYMGYYTKSREYYKKDNPYKQYLLNKISMDSRIIEE